MNLVLIHGRDQQGKNKDKLAKEWMDALNEGLTKSGLVLPQGINIIFPFYGDLLDSLVKKVEEASNGFTTKGDAKDSLLEFEYELYSEVAENAGISDQEISKHVEGNVKGVQEKGPFNWEWVQGILRALDRHTPLGDASVKRFTRDVYTYLYYDAVRAEIDEFVLDALQPGPTVLVGHSLGSVIGYDILRDADAQIVEYITVGSPLGLNSIKKKLATPLAFPDAIQGDWFNAYDDRDYVALHPLDNRNFDIDPAVINYDRVLNKTSNRHGITGYLDDKEVAKRIYDALT